MLEDAKGPEPLPDGSLLVTRLNKDRKSQLYRYWPESRRIEALNAFPAGSDLCQPVRVFHDGKGSVFLGETAGPPTASPHLYVIDLISGKVRQLAPELDLHLHLISSMDIFPIAVTNGDESVLVELQDGYLRRVVSIPLHGQGSIRTLFTLTSPASFLSVDKNGNIYLDLADRPMQVLRTSESGGTPEVLAGPVNVLGDDYLNFQLPDGRVAFDSPVGGRSRLVAAKPGGEATPLIQTKEETGLPGCLVGEGEIAFFLGALGHRVVAVASIADGRIARRFDGIPGNDVTSLAASPDRKTLYYVASGSVWAISASGGGPHRIAQGDAVAADPNGKDMIVQLIEQGGVRLMKVPVSGGAAQPIPIQSTLRLAPVLFSTNAVGKDGRILASITTPDSWYYSAGILDPRSGKLERIPIDFTGDLMGSGWLGDGRILSSGWELRSTLWRFRLVAGEEH